MIFLLLKLIFITYIIVVAYTAASQEDMLLSGIRKQAEEMKEAGIKIAQIFICPWCGSSFFSIIGILVAYGLGIVDILNWNILFLYFLTVCGASVASGLTWGWYEMVNARKEFYEKAGIDYE